MFDFAWSELALIGVVALIVIGPKDLPRVMRTVATYVRKARTIAHEFQGHLEQMVRDAELDEVKKEVERAAQLNLHDEITKTIDPKGELQAAFRDPLLDAPTPEPAKLEPPPAELPAPAEAKAPPVELSAPIEAEAPQAAPPAPTHHTA